MTHGFFGRVFRFDQDVIGKAACKRDLIRAMQTVLFYEFPFQLLEGLFLFVVFGCIFLKASSTFRREV